MEYDFRNRTSSSYDAQIPPFRPAPSPPTPSSHPMYGQSLYPKVGQSGPSVGSSLGRHQPSVHQTSAPFSSSSGLGIRVTLKPEYRITPPPQLAPLIGDIPRSNFQFDFDLERKILAEAQKENPNWSRLGLENLPSKPPTESTSSLGSVPDPVVSKYVACGLDRQAVPIAVANYGDNPTKVREFANAFTLLREMGFSSNNVAEVLLMCDNDTDKALAHFLNNSS
ncbi:hypothetical protein K2173_011804 [Erythroxylum novogranatense]|uniref:UBA domain-containing protein n=1 Tax=Erythroxylum novogranatense TaxID=1862640 RepID=A0AAV8SL74_9ROSI|nr:hypothetical protein K2173_011804 [Erythroxylum novogranatense]